MSRCRCLSRRILNLHNNARIQNESTESKQTLHCSAAICGSCYVQHCAGSSPHGTVYNTVPVNRWPIRLDTQHSKRECKLFEDRLRSKSHYEWRSVRQSWCRTPLGAHNQITVQLTDDKAPRSAGWVEMEERGPGIGAGKPWAEGHERARRQDGKRPWAREDTWRYVDQQQCRQRSVKTKAFGTIYIYIYIYIYVHTHLVRNSYRTQSASITKVNVV